MSGLARYVVDAVVLERRSPTELAREHGITRRWIHKLVKRFKEGGYPALEPALGDRTHVPIRPRRRRRRANPRPDPRPKPFLSTARWPLACAQCLATGENYVLREDMVPAEVSDFTT